MPDYARAMPAPAPNLALLRRAIELSRVHSKQGQGGPFGAIVAEGDLVVAEGWNQVLSTCDPTAHAEVVAIRRAAGARRDFSLRGCVLYASAEPCPMCLAAIHWARIDAVYFAAGRDDAAAIGFDDALLYDELAKPLEARRLPVSQALRDEAVAVMQTWSASPGRILY
jgi:guanine deaminase